MKKMRKDGKKKKIIFSVILLVAVAATVVAVFAVKGRKKTLQASLQPSTIVLERMDLTQSISATGSIESKRTKSVSAAVQNVTVEKLLVQVGDTVKKGEELVRFDQSDLKDALSDAQDNLSNVTTSARQEIARAQKQYNTAQETRTSDNALQESKIKKAQAAKTAAKKEVATAKKKYQAAKNAQEKATCQEMLTKAEEALRQAESELENAKESKKSTNRQNTSSVDNAQTALETARSNADKSIKEAQKQVTEAQETLKECSLTASMDGIVTAVNVAAGDNYSGDAAVQIDDISSFTVTTTVDEYSISNVKKGQKVIILTEATDEDELEGTITFVAPSTDSTSKTSTSQNAGAQSESSSGYEVRIRIKTKDDRLRMGLTAKCSILLEETENVYAVPYDAIHEDSDGSTYIYVAQGNAREEKAPDFNKNEQDQRSDRNSQDDTSEQTKIEVTKGMESDYYVEISGDGLTEGLRVIMPTDATSETSEQSKDDKRTEGMGDFGAGKNGFDGNGSRDHGMPGGMQPGRQ